LAFYLGARAGRPYRSLGYIYLVVLVLMIVEHGKSYYMAAVYPPLFAAGGLVVDRVMRPRALGWLVPCLLAAGGLAFAPLAKAILPEETFIRYQHALGQDARVGVDEQQTLGRLPQMFADQHGWREMVEEIARVYDNLPAEDRAHACIFTQNY